MDLPQPVSAALAAALAPNDRERLTARRDVAAALADGRTHTFESLVHRVLTTAGVPPRAAPDEVLDIPRTADGDHGTAVKAIDRDFPVLARPRPRAAAAEAVAAFDANGLALPSVAPVGSVPTVSVTVRTGNMTGGHAVPVAPQPVTQDAYALAPAHRAHPRPELLDPAVFEAGTGGVLGERGARCLREGIVAHRRGLHLAAANLLAAASESAWYRVAERLIDADPSMAGGRLDRAVAEDRTAEVLRLTSDTLREKGGKRAGTVVTEAHAHAARFRDLRNYGLHPREDISETQEHAFTEAGCALLFMDAHRYFGQLAALADTATSTSS